MYSDNLLNFNAKWSRWFYPKHHKSGRHCKIKTVLSPTKIFYLWEKNTLRRIELFSME